MSSLRLCVEALSFGGYSFAAPRSKAAALPHASPNAVSRSTAKLRLPRHGLHERAVAGKKVYVLKRGLWLSTSWVANGLGMPHLAINSRPIRSSRPRLTRLTTHGSALAAFPCGLKGQYDVGPRQILGSAMARPDRQSAQTPGSDMELARPQVQPTAWPRQSLGQNRATRAPAPRATIGMMGS